MTVSEEGETAEDVLQTLTMLKVYIAPGKSRRQDQVQTASTNPDRSTMAQKSIYLE